MRFCTSVHCMDGRIQEPILKYLKEKYKAEYVDTITEPGPCKILAEDKDKHLVNSILARVAISVDRHKSGLIAVSGHYDCAGNPCDETTQRSQVRKSVEHCRRIYPDLKIIGLWIDNEWKAGEA